MSMVERLFGERSGFSVPRASIGAMRIGEDHDKAAELIRHAIDSGMRYIDTSRLYADSELKLAKALKDGYREKVILSTKWSPWIKKIEDGDDSSAECIRRRMEEQMARLEVDYLDFYQVWFVASEDNWQAATEKGGMVEGILKAKDEGLIGHTGFTTHDKPENVVKYIDEADWCEILLVTYNLLNTQYAPVLEAAHEKGIGTLVMNPLGGGRLAPPSIVLQELADAVGAKSIADLAIRYVMSNANVDTILCGMSKMSDVDDTIDSTTAGAFDEGQINAIDRFLDTVAAERDQYCTGCRYCMPCPHEVDIPRIMGMIFDDRVWGHGEHVKKAYENAKIVKADACMHCGECEAKCTQSLSIMDDMEYALERYGG